MLSQRLFFRLNSSPVEKSKGMMTNTSPLTRGPLDEQQTLSRLPGYSPSQIEHVPSGCFSLPPGQETIVFTTKPSHTYVLQRDL